MYISVSHLGMASPASQWRVGVNTPGDSGLPLDRAGSLLVLSYRHHLTSGESGHHTPPLSLSLSHSQTSSVAVVSRSAQYLPGLQLEMSKLATVLLYISVRWTRLAVFNFQVSGVTGQQRRVSAGPRTHCSPLSSS